MRFRLGLITGFATGYYFGAKAGRERYRQLKGWVDGVRGSEAVETAAEKAKAVVDLGMERARDIVEQKTGDDTAEDPFPPEAPMPGGHVGTVNSGLPDPGTEGIDVPIVEVNATGSGGTS